MFDPGYPPHPHFRALVVLRLLHCERVINMQCRRMVYARLRRPFRAAPAEDAMSR